MKGLHMHKMLDVTFLERNCFYICKGSGEEYGS